MKCYEFTKVVKKTAPSSFFPNFLFTRSTENIINTLRKFDHDGIIRINGKAIEILDEKELQLVCRMG